MAEAASSVAKGSPLSAIFTGGEAADEEATRPAFGQPDPVVRRCLLGPSPKPIMRIPHQLVPAKGIKYRWGGWTVGYSASDRSSGGNYTGTLPRSADCLASIATSSICRRL
ncbi:MAG: hypothetical protein QF569_06630 [Candidatus Poribacteria bacterium]|nr:hypothetical protein [Candidatus Poribacteria bacterium]